MFWSIGAWPVSGFLGLEVLLIAYAFHFNYRAGRLAERIELDPDRLVLTRTHPSGQREVYAYNPYWVRLRLAVTRDGRTDLRLGLHGREVSFARFLNDEERRAFAPTLQAALHAARTSRF